MGLKKYIAINKINDSNLYLCDLICHGVSSPRVWKEYIKYMENKYNTHFTYISFRDKRNGWKNPTAFVKDKSREYSLDTFTNMYYSNKILRPSCYVCPYASINRISDITIGDFWGIEKSMPDFADNDGISLVLVNSDKGKKIFHNIQNSIISKKSNKDDCLQLNLTMPTQMPKSRKYFWKIYNLFGIKYIFLRYRIRNIYLILKKVISLF